MMSLLYALVVATQAAAPAPASPASAEEKKICRREQVTGSIMPGKRVCMTAPEWRSWTAKMQGNVNAFANRPQRAPNPDG